MANKNNDRNYYMEWAFVLAREAALLILAITSIVLIYSVSQSWASNHVDSLSMSRLIASIVTIIAYIAIDWLLGVIVDYVSDEAFSKEKKTTPEKILIGMVVFLSLLLLVVTGGISYWTGGEAANIAVEKPQTDKLTNLALQESKSFQESLSSVDSDIKEARRTESKRIREIKKEGKANVKNAISKGSENWQQLYLSNNSWFREKSRPRDIKKYISSIESEINKTNILLEKEKQKISNLESRKDVILSDNSLRKDTTLSSITKVISSKNNHYNTRFNNVWSLFFYMDIVCVFSIIFCTIVLGLKRRIYGKQVEKTYKGFIESGADVFFSLISAISSATQFLSYEGSKKAKINFLSSKEYAPETSAKSSAKQAPDFSTNGANVANGRKNDKLDPLSDKGSPEIEVRYVDLKNDIERSKKRWIRAMKKGDTDKAKSVESGAFEKIAKKGFKIEYDREGFKVKVSKKK